MLNPECLIISGGAYGTIRDAEDQMRSAAGKASILSIVLSPLDYPTPGLRFSPRPWYSTKNLTGVHSVITCGREEIMGPLGGLIHMCELG